MARDAASGTIEGSVNHYVLAYKEIWIITIAWGLVRFPVWAAIDQMPDRTNAVIIGLALTTASFCVLAYLGWKAKRQLGQDLKEAALAAAGLGTCMAILFIPIGIALEPYWHIAQGDISKLSGPVLLIAILIAAAMTAALYAVLASIGYLIAGIGRPRGKKNE